MIQKCAEADFPAVLAVINDGAQAYRGVIPADRWTDPYMTAEKLQFELEEGVEFWGWVEDDAIIGVMGFQHVQDVTLIRHAYVRTNNRRRGIGGQLLSHLSKLTNEPILIGTWADAVWAIEFYQRHGFELVPSKDELLGKYWSIPERQRETSVVLADSKWRARLP